MIFVMCFSCQILLLSSRSSVKPIPDLFRFIVTLLQQRNCFIFSLVNLLQVCFEYSINRSVKTRGSDGETVSCWFARDVQTTQIRWNIQKTLDQDAKLNWAQWAKSSSRFESMKMLQDSVRTSDWSSETVTRCALKQYDRLIKSCLALSS